MPTAIIERNPDACSTYRATFPPHDTCPDGPPGPGPKWGAVRPPTLYGIPPKSSKSLRDSNRAKGLQGSTRGVEGATFRYIPRPPAGARVTMETQGTDEPVLTGAVDAPLR